MQKTGRLSKIIFNNRENGYTVAVFDTEDGAIRIAGSFNEPKEGGQYKLEGSFTIHRKYGEQFSVTSYEELLPEGVEAIYEFLAAGNIRGIGPKTAQLITEAFGEDSLRIIEEEPEKLLSIKGIGPSSMSKIAESYGESRDFARISLELKELGVEMSHAVKIFKLYGKESVNIVKENPYTLVEDVYGITFQKADAIAEKIGYDADSEFRIESGIKYVLKTWAIGGSTLMPQETLVEQVIRLLDTQTEKVEDSIRTMAFNGEIQTDIIDDAPVVYLYGYYYAEQRIASNLRRILYANRAAIPAVIDNLINDAEMQLAREFGDVSLSDEQRSAVRGALLGNVSVITGGPGTGKTTIINVLVNIFKRLDYEVALAAPTGRAAKRMEEASGKPAQTIHRLLEYVYSEDMDEMSFGRNEERPLEYDAIIVDEASMIDIMLMDGLLAAIKDGTILIMTGDADQLPSVGAGNVLKDIIDSEYVYTARLKEIFRQAQGSRIVTNAHMINNGEYPEFGGKESDFFVITRANEDDIVSEIKGLVDGRLAEHYDFVNDASDIQILTPTKRGVLGAPSMNSILQEVINPANKSLSELKIGSRTFREGDKVMQLRNNYTAEWQDADSLMQGEGIFNGDMGTVESIDTENRTMLVRADNRLIRYEGEMFEEIDLAYAITVHKSQGSEFPVVILPMWQYPPMLMTRNLLYTAVTRGKKLVIIIGNPKYMQWMIDNNRADGRYTGLKYRLNEMI
ncbi:MAG: ATP-dependent RecD-like DNA helicase [Clostridiales bacterium]|nr:ATP-dependent RecD-like DNA helicase [Candidatus Crickella caballi]